MNYIRVQARYTGRTGRSAGIFKTGNSGRVLTNLHVETSDAVDAWQYLIRHPAFADDRYFNEQLAFPSLLRRIGRQIEYPVRL